VEQHLGLRHFFERGAEAGDQGVGQVADEADGVREEDLAAAGQLEGAEFGIESGKHARGCEDPGAGERVEERALAGVGVSDQGDGGDGTASRRWRCCLRTRRTALRSSLSWSMRRWIWRRSVSSLVSPGPRVPMPPPSWDMDLPRPVRRGSMYSSCASSTWSWPSRVRAWRAKMSRINWVRSRTRQGSAASRLRNWVGERSWSKRTRSASTDAARAAISSTLPEPMRVAGSGRGRRWSSSAATWAPALETSSRTRRATLRCRGRGLRSRLLSETGGRFGALPGHRGVGVKIRVKVRIRVRIGACGDGTRAGRGGVVDALSNAEVDCHEDGALEERVFRGDTFRMRAFGVSTGTVDFRGD